MSKGQRLEQLLGPLSRSDASLNLNELLDAGRVLDPIHDPQARILVSGTGLTHLGSASQREAMHQANATNVRTDSRRMFERGLAGGKPPAGTRGAAPEWFYKGDAQILRGPGQSLDIPPFAPDGGEEPEVVAVYIIDPAGVPRRVGFAQGNEWSDHVTENEGYLYLAPSKLRDCAIGPELVTDLNFASIAGRCRVLRAGETIYDSGELRTGEQHMCHSLANLEDHHFKFPGHRRPGDVHIHFLGTSKLSFQHRAWRYETGDIIEVAFEGFGEALRNPVRRSPANETPIQVQNA
jgi:hypothetical protein